MKKLLTGLISLLFISLGSGGTWAHDDKGFAVDREAAQLFATLPTGARFPEGITANPRNGDIYVGTFDTGAPNKLIRYDRHGRLEAIRDFGGDPLLGLEFDADNNKVYITNVGDFSGTGSRIQRIAANFDAGTAIEPVADIPGIGAPGPRAVGNPDGSVDTITFGDNARVIDWILRRLDGEAEAVDAPIGLLPTPESLNTEGLELAPGALDVLLSVNPHEWRAELDSTEHYLGTFGDALPAGLRSELASLRYRLDH